MTDEPGPAERVLYLAAVRGGGRLRPEELAAAGWPHPGLRPRAPPEDRAFDRRPARRGVGADRVAQVHADHPTEALSRQPGGARPTEHLAKALESNRRHIEKGGTMRTIYEASALSDPPTVAFAAKATELGVAIRVLPVPFTRLFIFGRAVAVIPAGPDYNSAAFIEDSAVVDFLVRDFELHWQQAEGVNWAALAGGSAETAVQVQIGRRLTQGLAQRAIATRLGLSERTVAGHIARLRERYDAETLFQLGWQMRGARDA